MDLSFVALDVVIFAPVLSFASAAAVAVVEAVVLVAASAVAASAVAAAVVVVAFFAFVVIVAVSAAVFALVVVDTPAGAYQDVPPLSFLVASAVVVLHFSHHCYPTPQV